LFEHLNIKTSDHHSLIKKKTWILRWNYWQSGTPNFYRKS